MAWSLSKDQISVNMNRREILEVRREMYSRSLWFRFGDGRVRSGLQERLGCI